MSSGNEEKNISKNYSGVLKGIKTGLAANYHTPDARKYLKRTYNQTLKNARSQK